MFGRKKPKGTYDRENKRPAIRTSICSGEQVAGFVDVHTGTFEEDMLIRDEEDLLEFKKRYGIEGEPERIW